MVSEVSGGIGRRQARIKAHWGSSTLEDREVSKGAPGWLQKQGESG